jgi:hypothetical protein
MRADPILTICGCVLLILLLIAAAQMDPQSPDQLGLF